MSLVCKDSVELHTMFEGLACWGRTYTVKINYSAGQKGDFKYYFGL